MTGRIMKKTAAKAAIAKIPAAKMAAAKMAAAMMAALVISSGVCFAQASNKAQVSLAMPMPMPITQNVNVVNTPTVNVGALPAVNIAGTPTVNVATLPAVTVSGTPAVSAAQSGSWNVGLTGNPGVTVANTNSQPVPTLTAGPSLVTHMGQLPSNHVVLDSIASTSCGSWYRIAADGQASSFIIPAGNVLVITDVKFLGSGFAPGTYIVNLDIGGSGVMSSAVMVDASAWLSSEQHLTSGIVASALPTCGITGTNDSPSAYIYGYLIPAS